MQASRRALLALSFAVASSGAAANCYVVLSAGDEVVYRSSDAPFDLSGEYTHSLAAAFPGGPHHFVVSPDEHCPAVDTRRGSETASSRVSSVSDAIQALADRDSTLAGEYSGARDWSRSGAYMPATASRPGTDVQVRSYQKKDGTIVESHTRAAPGRGTSTRR